MNQKTEDEKIEKVEKFKKAIENLNEDDEIWQQRQKAQTQSRLLC